MLLNKKDYLDIIKTIEIIDGNISSDQDSGIIKINIVGMKMQQQEKQISLKSIYDLVINVQNNLNNFQDSTNKFQESTNKRFDGIENRLTTIEQDNKEIKQRLIIIENDVRELKSLPTIAKELKQNKIL